MLAVPSGCTQMVMVGSADCRFMPRKTELTRWVDRRRPNLPCNSQLNTGRALANETAHEDASQASLLNVEAREPLHQAPRKRYESASEADTFVVSHGNGDVMRVPQQLPAGERGGTQDTDLAMDTTPRKQMLEKQSDMQDADIASNAPQTSVEEAFGLLKEQVEVNRRIQLASKQGTEADIAKPLKRSKILAKQVISQSSAMAIGFVSQLWVCTRLFKVIALEVRPSLLSGEIDRVFLSHVCQIGDVVLVNDESALENETTAPDCETLVGYDVVTEDGKYIGKIRDYSFDLDDGKLTSLDFDSVGFSLVPSSLISTYRLDVEEVIEVLPDTILVKDGAESRIRRLTKGFWQLPAGGEKKRSQKMARNRMLKKTLVEGNDTLSMSRQLPPNMRSKFLEGSELEGLDERADAAERQLLRKDYRGMPPKYRKW